MFSENSNTDEGTVVFCVSINSLTGSTLPLTSKIVWRYCTVFLYCTVLYCTVLYCTVLYCTVLYCTVLYCTVLYCTVLYCTVLYCTVLYCTVLYCTVLYCTVLYCTVLYCTVLYCTVLYCTVLYCTVLLFLKGPHSRLLFRYDQSCLAAGIPEILGKLVAQSLVHMQLRRIPIFGAFALLLHSNCGHTESISLCFHIRYVRHRKT